MARRRSPKRQAPSWITALVAGILLGAGLMIGIRMAQHQPAQRPPHPAAIRTPPAGPAHPQTFPRPAAPPHAAPQIPRQNPEVSQGPAIGPGTPGPGVGRPQVAIIFDDAGYSMRAAQEVMDLGRPVTISVLPDLAYSTAIAEEAPRHGVQVILHLPLQPDNPSITLGPGGITVDMNDEEIERTVAADFGTVPAAVGANNHMGSRGTSDPRVMRAVLSAVKARHLFFVDSLTSPHSVAARVARDMGVPTAVRAVFLDNQDDEGYVRGQLMTLIKVAQERGQAVAIGHVGKVTVRVLRDMLPVFDEAGIRLVPVSQLVQ